MFGNQLKITINEPMLFIKNPFLRLIIPLIIGIHLQWYLQPQLLISIFLFIVAAVLTILFRVLKPFQRYKYGAIEGVLIMFSVLAFGMFLTWLKDVRNNQDWFGKYYLSESLVVATIQEPLTSKENSYKAEADVTGIINGKNNIETKGNVILYFKKDSLLKGLSVGHKIVFKKVLQEIKNSGNPGAFDYKKYCLFNGITHQVYLTGKDIILLQEKNVSWLKEALIKSRNYVIEAIQSNIEGKKEQGLAEAMLIGYRDDLDKALLKSYSNTGVVHVIAVSGMHLALLYWILNVLLSPLLKRTSTKWLHPVLVISLLWGFAFLTGGAASIVRAAIMFTLITIGKELNRTASIYNILAGAAFLQLCYNPYWVWDVGFQLSYIAVLSIIIFYKPIYKFWYIKNKGLNYVWQLASVSIAAQILTTPFSIFYFHQFPVYFLITNLVVVPASTLILIATLLLVIVSPFSQLSLLLGGFLEAGIKGLNFFIEEMEKLPFSVWGGLQINVFQVIFILTAIVGLSLFLISKYKPAIWITLVSVLLFFSFRTYFFYRADNQRKMIVYNISKHSVIDFIEGRNYYSFSDSAIENSPSVNDFVLTPARVFQRTLQKQKTGSPLFTSTSIQFHNKKIMLIDYSLKPNRFGKKMNADIVILRNNPRLYISNLISHISPSQIIIDGSVPAWKSKLWMKDCDSLGIPCHNVASLGAFVMNLY